MSKPRQITRHRDVSPYTLSSKVARYHADSTVSRPCDLGMLVSGQAGRLIKSRPIGLPKSWHTHLVCLRQRCAVNRGIARSWQSLVLRMDWDRDKEVNFDSAGGPISVVRIYAQGLRHMSEIGRVRGTNTTIARYGWKSGSLLPI
jgi:hypothetical protein